MAQTVSSPMSGNLCAWDMHKDHAALSQDLQQLAKGGPSFPLQWMLYAVCCFWSGRLAHAEYITSEAAGQTCTSDNAQGYHR